MTVRRHLLRAIVFTFFFDLLVILILPVAGGVFLTHTYVPDIVNAYDSATVLQQEVAFGELEQSSIGLKLLTTTLIGMGLYALIVLAATLFKRLFSSRTP